MFKSVTKNPRPNSDKGKLVPSFSLNTKSSNKDLSSKTKEPIKFISTNKSRNVLSSKKKINPPTYKSMFKEGNKLELQFRNLATLPKNSL